MITSLYTALYAHYLSGSFSQTWEEENEAQRGMWTIRYIFKWQSQNSSLERYDALFTVCYCLLCLQREMKLSRTSPSAIPTRLLCVRSKRIHLSAAPKPHEKHRDYPADVPDGESKHRCPGEIKFSYTHSSTARPYVQTHHSWKLPKFPFKNMSSAILFPAPFPTFPHDEVLKPSNETAEGRSPQGCVDAYMQSTRWAWNNLLCQKGRKCSRNKGHMSKRHRRWKAKYEN